MPRPFDLPGFRHLFAPPPALGPDLAIRGLGVHERRHPSVIHRPNGSGDCLFMVLHDPACVATEVDLAAIRPAETMMLWTPGMVQCYGHPDAPYSHSWIHCRGASVDAWLAACALPVGRPFRLTDHLLVPDALLAIHRELTAYAAPDPVIVANLLENLLRGVARQLRRDAGPERLPDGLVAAWRMIASEHAAPLTLADLARAAGLSPSQFSSRFRAAYGRSPVACLIEHRLAHAAYLLADPGLGVAEVAEQVGYRDVFHFSRAFKRRFGRSPSGLRASRQADPTAPP